MQSVYVIGPKNGPFKVGIAKNPERRLGELQVGNHQELIIHHVHVEECAEKIEASVHVAMANKNIRGEWISADLDEIIKAIEDWRDAQSSGHDPFYRMTPEAFAQWIADMKSAGLARSDVDCARAIGKTNDTILKYKRAGTDLTVALACAAALAGLKPYGAPDDPAPF